MQKPVNVVGGINPAQGPLNVETVLPSTDTLAIPLRPSIEYPVIRQLRPPLAGETETGSATGGVLSTIGMLTVVLLNPTKLMTVNPTLWGPSVTVRVSQETEGLK